jgi:hypothetical protein
VEGDDVPLLIPALGELVDDLAGLVEADEWVHDLLEDERGDVVRRQGRVERRGLGPDIDPEQLLRRGLAPSRVPCFAVVVVSAAPGEAESEHGDERGEKQKPSLTSHFSPPLVQVTAIHRSCGTATTR